MSKILLMLLFGALLAGCTANVKCEPPATYDAWLRLQEEGGTKCSNSPVRPDNTDEILEDSRNTYEAWNKR